MTVYYKKNAALKRVYRLSYRRGKKALAVVLDAAAFGALLLAALYIVIRPRFQNRTAAVFTTLSAGAEAALVCAAADRIRYDRHVKKLRAEAAEEAAERLMLLDPGRVWDSLPDSPSVYVSKSLEGVTADEILAALAEKERPVTVVSLAGKTASAERVSEAAAGAVRIISPAEMGIDAAALYPVGPEDIDRRILAKHADLLKKPSIRLDLFRLNGGSAAKYLAVGGGLMIASFFVKHPLYYRAVASAALGTGGYALIAGSLFSTKGRPGADAGTP